MSKITGVKTLSYTGESIIGEKWYIKSKLDEQGKVERNKARLVATSYSNRKVLTILQVMLLLQDYKLFTYYSHLLYLEI